MKVQNKQKIKLLKSLACITITVYLVSFTGPAASQSEQLVSSKDIFSNSKQNPDADWLNKIIGSKIKVSFSKKTDITSIEKGLKIIAEIPGIVYGKVSGRLNVDENSRIHPPFKSDFLAELQSYDSRRQGYTGKSPEG